MTTTDQSCTFRQILMETPGYCPPSILTGGQNTSNPSNRSNQAPNPAHPHLGTGEKSVTSEVTCASNQSHLDDRRAWFGRLLSQIERLRCEDPPKRTRREALVAVRSNINLFAAKCDMAAGYHDPEDPFAADCLAVLRDDLAELEAGPYPLGPLGDDPIADGRRFNGKPL